MYIFTEAHTRLRPFFHLSYTIMKTLAFICFLLHLTWACSYLYVVIEKIALGTYILDMFNTVMSLVSTVLHYHWFIEYTQHNFLLPQFIQLVASVWQFMYLFSINGTKGMNYDINCMFTLFSVIGLAFAFNTGLEAYCKGYTIEKSKELYNEL